MFDACQLMDCGNGPLKDAVSLIRGKTNHARGNLKCNPLILTIKPEILNQTAQVTKEEQEGKLREWVEGLYSLRISVEDKGAAGRFRIMTLNEGETLKEESKSKMFQSILNDPKIVKTTAVDELSKTLEIETGYGELHVWMEWVKYTVKSLDKSDCFACAAGRPIAQIIPVPFGWDNNPEDMKCILALYQEETAWNDTKCAKMSLRFPALKPQKQQTLPVFSPSSRKHTACISRQAVLQSRHLGELGTCSAVQDLSGEKERSTYSNLQEGHMDLWWYCCGRKLWVTLPPQWAGTCAVVQLAISFTLAFQTDIQEKGRVRKPRSISEQDILAELTPKGGDNSVNGSFDERIYLDMLGVPGGGVPDEFKARNPVAAGFEYILPWIMINKIVDWINYIFYNQQRFIKHSRNAIRMLLFVIVVGGSLGWRQMTTPTGEDPERDHRSGSELGDRHT
ncbi:LOW QUALITY PROTEIN: uncharacterized protein LOC115095456, partial [Rhinatrema bivittatum]|uniref:LOW QUALITY PROTEIN: uncharacterized protein LOC115095456 n=1 Tax=Rhinatrema bivittatum TaxID=194408 RepID=UPI00112ABE84